MGAESVTGGVRDTLAVAVAEAIWGNTAQLSAAVAGGNRAADAVLAALSSPEVVRVATEHLVEHHGERVIDRHPSGVKYMAVRCCGVVRSETEHAAHQWSVLVAALRGER